VKESRGGRESAPSTPGEHERAPAAHGSGPRSPGAAERLIVRAAPPAQGPSAAPASSACEPRALGAPLSADDLVVLDGIAARSFPGAPMSLAEELAKPWSKVWVVRLVEPSGAARPVGFLIAWHVVDELHVLHVATDPAHRREGHGEALMRVVLEHASEARARMILLEVRRSNRPAIKLYRKLGFWAMGMRPRYYADGEDAVELVLQLDPETGQIVAGRDEVLVLAGPDGRS
jgi:ribosomal-protein-alanine N-acetyltransferase